MPIFKYTALNQQGEVVEGLQEAENQKHATQVLATQALILTGLKSVKQDTKHQWFATHITPKHLSLYLRQLAMMLKTGLPVEMAVDALIQQSSVVKHKTIWSAIKTSINEGVSLSQAMGEFPKSFPALIIANIASGEQSGQLGEVLDKTAQTLTKKQQFQAQIQQALAYPVIVSLIALLVIVALLTFVVPQIIDVFSQLDKTLPPLTVGLISLSNFLKNYLMHLSLVLLAMILGVKWLKSQPNLKYYWDLFWLKMPFSSLIKNITTIQFTRTITILLGSGVAMVDAIYYSLNSVDNLVIRKRLEVAAKTIKEGSDVFIAFKACHLFDPTSLQLIYFGQTTGQIEQTFAQISDILESELERKTKIFLSIFEPLLILVMGGIVLLIVLAIMLPILGLNEIL